MNSYHPIMCHRKALKSIKSMMNLRTPMYINNKLFVFQIYSKKSCADTSGGSLVHRLFDLGALIVCLVLLF